MVVTTAMDEGSILVANLREAATVHLRQSPTVETSRGGYDEFVHNVSLIRCEERLALAIVRPSALCLISSGS
jgi:Phage capsid family